MTHKSTLTPSDKVKPPRTDTFELTISGLLTKRAQMFYEARGLRERMAELSNDVAALDRVLTAFGYDGELDAIMPREKAGRMFNNGQLMRRCLQEVRNSGPITARDIAEHRHRLVLGSGTASTLILGRRLSKSTVFSSTSPMQSTAPGKRCSSCRSITASAVLSIGRARVCASEFS